MGSRTMAFRVIPGVGVPEADTDGEPETAEELPDEEDGPGYESGIKKEMTEEGRA